MLSAKGADAPAGWNLKGGVPTAGSDMSGVPQQAATGGAGPGAAQLTDGNLVLVTRDDHQKLPTVAQQGKIYTHMSTQMTPEPAAVSTRSKEPAHIAGPTPGAAAAATFGPAPVLPETNRPEPAEAGSHGKYCKNKPAQSLLARN